MKIGLILQGPIIGGGLTGATYGQGKTNAPVSKFKSFDATESIKANIKLGKRFDQIVISTWESEPTEALEEFLVDFPNCAIIKSLDPTPNPKQSRKPVPGIPFVHQANKVRMFYSTRMGLELLREAGIDYAIKIRTDQTIDLELLYNEFLSFAMGNQKKIFLPLLRENTPWIASDFYFGARVDLLESLCKFLECCSNEFHENVHVDFFFKSYFLIQGIYENNDLRAYFIDTNTDPVSRDTDAIIRKSIDLIWSPGSRKLYESIVWRGEKLRFIQKDSYFNGSTRAFKFDYQVGNWNRNANFNTLKSIALGEVNVIFFLLSYFCIAIRKRFRLIRSKISTFRDHYGLRF
jgi:hypothetical protein